MVMSDERIEAVKKFLEEGEPDEAIRLIAESVAEFGHQPLMNARMLAAIADLEDRVRRLEQDG